MNHVLCTVHIFKIHTEIFRNLSVAGQSFCISGSPKRSYGSSVSDTTVFQKFRYVQLKLMLFKEAFHIIRRQFSEEACS